MIFGAGVIIFLFYSATKSIFVGIFVFLLVGVPALALAFAKINGRPIYSMLPVLLKSFTGAKVLIFHKEAKNFSGNTKLSSIEMKEEEPIKEKEPKEDRQTKMKKLNKMLQSTAEQEKELAKKIR